MNKIKNLTAAVLTTLTIGLFVTATSVAKTPDGFTPNEETVCDALLTEGTTNGLYGLCVAFCEARDIITSPVTEDELAVISEDMPNAKILKQYNLRKKAEDPSMPCVIVAQTCPLWSSSLINSFDGDTVYGADTALVICNGHYIAERTKDRSQLDADGNVLYQKHPTDDLAAVRFNGRALSDVASLAYDGIEFGTVFYLEGPAVNDCLARFESARAQQCPAVNPNY